MTRRLIRILATSSVLVALILSAACDAQPETISRREYLELVAGWRERDSDIRDRAARAAGDDTNDAFAALQEECGALRRDIAAVTPPPECAELRDALVKSQEHFGTALGMLGEGEDIAAIDELVLSNEEIVRMKAELERFGTEI